MLPVFIYTLIENELSHLLEKRQSDLALFNIQTRRYLKNKVFQSKIKEYMQNKENNAQMFYLVFLFFFLLSGSFLACVRYMKVKKAPNPKLITPMKVIIMVTEGGAMVNPIIIPIMPVAKNIIIKTLTLVGSMYLITGLKRWQYYKLTVNSNFRIL